MPSQDNDDTLSKIVQNLATAQTYLSKAVSLVAKYQDAVAPVPLGQSRGTNTAIHSLQMWAEYLAEHGPTPRADLDAATNLSLTKSGYDRTQAWVGPMTYMADDALPDDAVMRIKGLSSGVGRPPVIYFIWRDRWLVLPKYGVGPTKPDNVPAPIELPDDAMVAAPLLGVIQPPISAHPIDPAYGEELPIGWPESEPARCATMEEWDRLHAAFFDGMVASESKPTDEQKQMLRDSLPVGADGNASLAIAYRSAAQRSDRSGWEMLGPHNHLEHPWSPLCEVSKCIRTNG